jgi:NADH dehydrogenase
MVSPTARMAPTLTLADRQTAAVYGRSRATAAMGRLQLSGWLAWWAWLFVHLFFLIGLRNRLGVLCDWTYSYLTYQRGERLITAGRRLAEAPGAVAAAEG